MAFFFPALSAQGALRVRAKSKQARRTPKVMTATMKSSQVASSPSPIWPSNHATAVDERLQKTHRDRIIRQYYET